MIRPETNARTGFAATVVWALAALVLCAGDGFPGMSRALAQQEDGADTQAEYNVKAVFLYNFARFVQWPDEAGATSSSAFVIAIVGSDPFQGALDEIAAKRNVRGRPITLRRLAAPEQLRAPCHIVFISRSVPAEQQATLLQKAPGRGILLVGETAGLAERGAVCNFVVEDGRIRFEINVEAAKRAELRMDAKLLALGITVHERWPASSGKTAGGPAAPFPQK